jgi:SHS2 domain-containing protein
MGCVPVKYEFIEHTADLSFRVYGRTLEELFAHAGEAFFEALIDLEVVEERVEKTIETEAEALDDLMVNWLGELLYLHDTEGFLFKRFEVESISGNRLKARAAGEVLDLSRHEIKTGVKAVTYHQLYVEKREAGWEAQVILDL